jgi:hypothetical protein
MPQRARFGPAPQFPAISMFNPSSAMPRRPSRPARRRSARGRFRRRRRGRSRRSTAPAEANDEPGPSIPPRSSTGRTCPPLLLPSGRRCTKSGSPSSPPSTTADSPSERTHHGCRRGDRWSRDPSGGRIRPAPLGLAVLQQRHSPVRPDRPTGRHLPPVRGAPAACLGHHRTDR